jgi:hypothetical protein
MQLERQFRLTNEHPVQEFSLMPEGKIHVKQIAVLSLWGIQKPASWFTELFDQGLEVVVRYSNETGGRKEQSYPMLPWVSPQHARPVFDDFDFNRQLIFPFPEDDGKVFTKASVEVVTNALEIPFDVAFTCDYVNAHLIEPQLA